MQYYNNILCVTCPELTQGDGSVMDVSGRPIVSKNNYNVMVQRHKITVVRPGKGKGCCALIDWSSLSSEIQKRFVAKYGDPTKIAKKEDSFKKLITPDTAADTFYRTYMFGCGEYLKPEYVAKYVANAEVLNAVNSFISYSATKRRALGINGSIGSVWEYLAQTVASLKEELGHDLPENPSRLSKKLKEYKRNGYEVLISGKFGNKNTTKVKDIEQEATLRKLLSDHRNLDNEQIRMLYNMMAEKLEWKKITAATVGNKRKLWELQTYGGQRGEKAFDNAKAMLIKRKAPVYPLYYWTVDGWDVELFYQKQSLNKDNNRVTTYTNRLTMVIVLDPCCKYPVGYAIGDHETVDLNKAAIRNAINHTKELFGCRYKPLQLQTDNYGRGALTPFYEAATLKYTPAKVKNAKAKTIEPYNKYLNKTYCQLMPNWSGFGVTADKSKQPNDDFLNKIRHGFPSKEGCFAQIEFMIAKEREKKLEAYITAYGNMPLENKHVFSDEDYLFTLGETTGYTNRLSHMGLVATIGGSTKYFDSFEAKFRELAHVDWVVKYDPSDLSQVLVVSAKKEKTGIVEVADRRFLLQEKHVQPMALIDRQEEDSEKLQLVKAYNATLKEDIVLKMSRDQKVIDTIFAGNPQLNDTLAKFVICDSKGQHKDHKAANRLQSSGVKMLVDQKKKEEKRVVNAWEEEQQSYISEKVDLVKYL